MSSASELPKFDSVHAIVITADEPISELMRHVCARAKDQDLIEKTSNESEIVKDEKRRFSLSDLSTARGVEIFSRIS